MILLAAVTIAISIYPSWLFELADIAARQLSTSSLP
jgi:hypothetical protein